MTRWMAAWVAFAALAWAGSLYAHHGASMFEPSALWVKGGIVEFARINPHSLITVDEMTVDGQVHRWAVQGADILKLERQGIGRDFLKAGDVIEVCVFPMKDEFSTPASGDPTFVQGEVMVMPDGNMQIWNTYGKLRSCVRPDDKSQVWADFLNSNSLARTAWCRHIFSPVPSRDNTKALIDEIDSFMDYPCE